jgi:membrane-bound serine protease (ClpP class)
VFGAYLLFNTGELEVPWPTIIALALITAGFFAFAIGKAVAALHRQPTTGMEGMMGAQGEVRQTLDPEGLILVSGELWRAAAEAGPIAAGQRVVVVGQEGFRLRVRKL